MFFPKDIALVFRLCGKRSSLPTLRVLSTAARSIGDLEGSEKSCRRDGYLFPWRECRFNPPNRSSFNTRLSGFVADHLTSEREFKVGSKQAFECAVASIFFNNAIRQNKLHTTNSKCSEDNMNVDLDDVFGPALTKFYQEAIQHIGSQHLFSLNYTLHNFSEPKIVSRDILMFTSKDREDREFLQRVDVFGVGVLVARGKEVSPFDVNFADSILLRVKVEFECEETFYVRDCITGTILQGSVNMETVRHKLLLQNIVNAKTMEGGSWQIVDIDEWLEGNEEWIKNQFG